MYTLVVEGHMFACIHICLSPSIWLELRNWHSVNEKFTQVSFSQVPASLIELEVLFHAIQVTSFYIYFFICLQEFLLLFFNLIAVTTLCCVCVLAASVIEGIVYLASPRKNLYQTEHTDRGITQGIQPVASLLNDQEV